LGKNANNILIASLNSEGKLKLKYQSIHLVKVGDIPCAIVYLCHHLLPLMKSAEMMSNSKKSTNLSF